jgi:hypothetical protein
MEKLIPFDRSGDKLKLALDEFQRNLSPDQRNEFNSIASNIPTANDVVLFTKEIELKNSGRRSRIMANRMTGVLESVQQYCAIIDTLIQSNPGKAALVWGSVKFVILVCTRVVFGLSR